MALPLIGAGVSLGGSILGAFRARGESRKAAQLQQEIQQMLDQGIDIPTIEQLMKRYEDAGFVGSLRDQLDLETAETLGLSAFEDISVDPRLKDAQMDALGALQMRGEMGLTPTEQAELNALRRSAAGTAQAQSASVLQDMAQRGNLDSGMQLAAQLSAGQNAAQQQSAEQDRMAAMAFQQALQSLQGAGELGGNIRGQEFGEQATIAGKRDAIDQFNLENRRDIAARNIAARNQAAERDLGIQQSLEAQRAANRNAEEDARVQGLLDINRMQTSKVGSQVGAKQGQVAHHQANAGNAGQSAGQALQSGINFASQAGIFNKKDDKNKPTSALNTTGGFTGSNIA
jgi:hypothetical protein